VAYLSGVDKGTGTGSVRNASGTLSRTTFYKWLKRYQKDGLKGLLDRPNTPLRKRAPTVRKKYELDIIRIRNNNPTWSKKKIAIERYQRISELKNRQSHSGDVRNAKAHLLQLSKDS